MAYLRRIVLPGIPHHLTQRDNRERLFFQDGDYALYIDLLADAASRAARHVSPLICGRTVRHREPPST